jgi:MFS family permease
MSSSAATEIPAEAAAPTPPPVPLRRNLKFQTLWAGQAAASLGMGVADVAYPLAILALTGSPARAGLFAAVQVTGMLLAGLPAGQLADAVDRQLIVIAAAAGRAFVTAVVVAGLVSGFLSLPILLAAAALLGVGQAVSSAAGLPLVRSVVPASQLTSALIQDEVRTNGALLIGPPLAGALYGIRALSHAAPFMFIAGAFAVAAVCAALMTVVPASPGSAKPVRPGRPATRDAGRTEPLPSEVASTEAAPAPGGMLSGTATLWANPVLRAAMLLIMIVNLTGAGLDLVVIVILRQQHVPAGGIGLALGAGAVGGLAGAPLVRVLHRLQPGVLLLSVGLLWVPLFALLAIPAGPWWAAGLMLAGMLAVPSIRVLVDVLVFRQTPDDQRGRVVAAVMTLIGLGMPAGVAGAGLLLQSVPASTAVLMLAGLLAAGVLYCASQRELWRARWPQQVVRD